DEGVADQKKRTAFFSDSPHDLQRKLDAVLEAPAIPVRSFVRVRRDPLLEQVGGCSMDNDTLAFHVSGPYGGCDNTLPYLFDLRYAYRPWLHEAHPSKLVAGDSGGRYGVLAEGPVTMEL